MLKGAIKDFLQNTGHWHMHIFFPILATSHTFKSAKECPKILFYLVKNLLSPRIHTSVKFSKDTGTYLMTLQLNQLLSIEVTR